MRRVDIFIQIKCEYNFSKSVFVPETTSIYSFEGKTKEQISMVGALKQNVSLFRYMKGTVYCTLALLLYARDPIYII